MMIRRWGAVLAVIMALLILAAGAEAFGQSFSADVVSGHGKEVIQGKMYLAGNKVRFETGGMISITRMDKRVVWLLMPSEKMYMEQSIRMENIVPSSEPVAGEVSRTLLGTENINGQAANKYRVTVQHEGKRNSFLQWLAVDSGLPLRMAAEDGKWWQEYRNIRIGEPDPALFEVPDGYQKFAMSM